MKRSLTKLKRLARYEDALGNRIDYAGAVDGVQIVFKGSRNTLVVHPRAKVTKLTVLFDCNDGHCEIGAGSFKGMIRVGQECRVSIGNAVTCTAECYISTAERTSVEIGEDCMIASLNEIRADDAHPIFDLASGQRVNPSRSIRIGRHVWLGARAVVLGGSVIGDGAAIGLGSIVKGEIPPNCVAAGVPARVVRSGCVWERPHLTRAKPYFKPDVSVIETSAYWRGSVNGDTD